MIPSCLSWFFSWPEFCSKSETWEKNSQAQGGIWVWDSGRPSFSWWGQFSSFAPGTEANSFLWWWRYHGNTLHCSLENSSLYERILLSDSRTDCRWLWQQICINATASESGQGSLQGCEGSCAPLQCIPCSWTVFNLWSIFMYHSCIFLGIIFSFLKQLHLHLKIIRGNNSSYSYTFFKVSWSKNPSLASCVCSAH